MLPLTIFFESLTTPPKKSKNYDSQLDSDKKGGSRVDSKNTPVFSSSTVSPPMLYYYRVGRLLETSFPVEKSEMIPGLSHERRKGGGGGGYCPHLSGSHRREEEANRRPWPVLALLLRRRHSSGVVRCKHPERQRRTEKSSKANLTPIPKKNERAVKARMNANNPFFFSLFSFQKIFQIFFFHCCCAFLGGGRGG